MEGLLNNKTNKKTNKKDEKNNYVSVIALNILKEYLLNVRLLNQCNRDRL